MSEHQLAALHQVLAAEHATIWGYGVVGAKVSQLYLPKVIEADHRHRSIRATIEDAVRSLGGEPVPSKPGYALPTLLTDDASALTFAAQLEESMSRQWRHGIGTAGPIDVTFRQLCLDGLDSAAGGALTWRRLLDPTALPQAFPGIS